MAEAEQTDKWAAITARVFSWAALDIDAICGAFDPRREAVGRDIYPSSSLLPRPAMKSDETVAVGVRVIKPPERPGDLAMRLASLGYEKGVEVIVLNHLDYSGLEMFGFRNERVTGETAKERAACEAEICRFWNIELVV